MPSDIQPMTQWLHTQSSVGATSGLACLSSIVVILAVILHHFQQRYRSTSFLTSWNGTAVNLRERVALAVTARSPIDRLIEYKRQRGFANLPLCPTCPASTRAPMSILKTPTSRASASP